MSYWCIGYRTVTADTEKTEWQKNPTSDNLLISADKKSDKENCCTDTVDVGFRPSSAVLNFDRVNLILITLGICSVTLWGNDDGFLCYILIYYVPQGDMMVTKYQAGNIK